MMVDTDASLHFLRTAHEPNDWIAVFLKGLSAWLNALATKTERGADLSSHAGQP